MREVPEVPEPDLLPSGMPYEVVEAIRDDETEAFGERAQKNAVPGGNVARPKS